MDQYGLVHCKARNIKINSDKRNHSNMTILIDTILKFRFVSSLLQQILFSFQLKFQTGF